MKYVASSDDKILSIGDGIIGLPSNRIPAQPNAWYRADFVVKTAENKVTQWTDLSGNERHLLQGLSAYQPTWVDNQIGGKPSVMFDGHFLRTSFGLTFQQPNTIILVYRHISLPTSINIVFDGISSELRHYMDARTSAPEWGGGTGVGLFAGSFHGYSKTLQNLQMPVIKSILYYGNNSVVWEFGQQVWTGFSDSLGVQGINGLTLGARFTDENFMQGYISEFIFFDRQLQHEERVNIENNLRNYYAL